MDRDVVGFFIVEGARDTGEVRSKWRAFARDTVSTAALKGSLPHRGEEERRAIEQSFRGVTTWQTVCREFRIQARLPEEISVRYETGNGT